MTVLLYNEEYGIHASFKEIEGGGAIVLFEGGETITSETTTLEIWINNGWSVVEGSES